ncbi:GNAT family N-acetyltransferase [Prosthecomicrobium hirschii]|uniref:GNAT family N-acetyltransferase n=1 Tax=Prosthecodimorpha hirschii TaxID=665126 RepID=UPI00221FA43B|nr:GNAT family N-acetyltransferase [Prosthecomicrobium hirschii]MCW1839091.1 GNAT family N-acetyltransferase [Prosthecomicrobium hirschii]
MPKAPAETATLRVAAGIAEIGRETWDALANPGWRLAPGGPVRLGGIPEAAALAYNPFLSYDFLAALEESGSVSARAGWTPRHLVLEGADGAPAALAPCYAKSHSQGEYVFDHSWAQAYERAGGRYYPKLQVSVPFTPATGPRLLVRPGAPATRDRALLVEGLAGFARQAGASSVHATFLIDDDVAAFESGGWLARTDQQFHWPNRGFRDFDDFLDSFQSRKRKQVKRERRDALADGVEIVAKTGAEIREADWDAFYAFYMDTGGRKWGRPYLNRTAFALIGERLADAVLLVLATRHGRPIAGALNLIGSDALYGRYWGAVEEQPFLHFEVCYYQAIEFAIRRGLARVEAGAQGEHKLARGYLPTTTRSAHFIVDPGLRKAVDRYLAMERQEVAQIGDMLAAHAPYRHADGAEADGF